jgi:hypothetical protein
MLGAGVFLEVAVEPLALAGAFLAGALDEEAFAFVAVALELFVSLVLAPFEEEELFELVDFDFELEPPEDLPSDETFPSRGMKQS